VAQKRDRSAYCFQHLDLEYASANDGGGANLDVAFAALSSGPPVVARFGQKWNSLGGNKTRSFNILGGIQTTRWPTCRIPGATAVLPRHCTARNEGFVTVRCNRQTCGFLRGIC
jgi:hypothetical protein